MINSSKKRLNEAKSIILRCVGKQGIYAGTHRYRYQCWTRDLSYSIDALINLGQQKVVKMHLLTIAKKQNRSGRVPILYITSYLGFLRIHAYDLLTHRKRFIHQVRLYASKFNPLKFSFQNITPWTTDGEMLFIIAAMRYFERTQDKEFLHKIYPNLKAALNYTETHNMNAGGFVTGGDWRDVNIALDNSALLINNVLLYRVYVLLEEKVKANALKERINDAFWIGSYYRDRLDSDDFDTLGQSWAVLYDVVPSERYASIVEKYRDVDSMHGLRINNNTPDNSLIDPSVQAFTDQFGTIWPFVTGSGILALIKMGSLESAVNQYFKWRNLEGFYEWYNSQNGNGLGDREQLWSAALYTLVCERLLQKMIFKSQVGLTIQDYLDIIPTFDLSVH